MCIVFTVIFYLSCFTLQALYLNLNLISCTAKTKVKENSKENKVVVIVRVKPSYNLLWTVPSLSSGETANIPKGLTLTNQYNVITIKLYPYILLKTDYNRKLKHFCYFSDINHQIIVSLFFSILNNPFFICKIGYRLRKTMDIFFF